MLGVMETLPIAAGGMAGGAPGAAESVRCLWSGVKRVVGNIKGCNPFAMTMTLKKIELVQLPQGAITALAAGDLACANTLTPFRMGPYFIGPESLSTWRRRASQILNEPGSAKWITRAIVDTDLGIAVGRAGFHGPPDGLGMVEVGYSIDPDFRRQGYARAALVAMLNWAQGDGIIQTVRASIAPDNIASRALVDQYGFVEVGEQWDDEDGREIIFEVQLR